MTKKQGITFFLSGIFSLCLVSQAQAVSITYNVDATFRDGGTLMGSIDIDSDGPPFVTDFDLTTAGGSLSGFNYVLGGGTTFTFGTQNNPNLTILNSGLNRALDFGGAFLSDWNPNLGTFSPTYTAGVRETVRKGFRLKKRSGNAAAVATPEPGTIILFGSGLLGLGMWRYRKNVAS